MGVADGEELADGEEDEGVGAFDGAAGLDNAGEEGAGCGCGDKVEKDLGVGGRVEDGATGLQVGAERLVVDEVAVVGDGELAESVAGEEGLHVEKGGGRAGSGIADMADGGGTGEGFELGRGEDLGDEAESGDGLEGGGVGGDDAGTLLAAVLEGVESKGAKPGSLRVADDPHHAALLPGLIVEQREAVLVVRRCWEWLSGSDGKEAAVGKGGGGTEAERNMGLWDGFEGKREGGFGRRKVKVGEVAGGGGYGGGGGRCGHGKGKERRTVRRSMTPAFLGCPMRGRGETKSTDI